MFKNMKIYMRMIILIGIATLALIINCIVGFSGFSSAEKSLEQIYYGSVDDIKELNEIKSFLILNVVYPVIKLQNGMISWDDLKESVKDSQIKIETMFSEYLTIFQQHDEGNITIKASNDKLQQFIKTIGPSLIRLQTIVQKQDEEELQKFITNELFANSEPIQNQVNVTMQDIVKDTRKDFDSANATLYTDKIILLTIFFIALIISITMSTLIALSITKPLKRSVEVINDIAEGDTTVEIENPTQDEVGQLQHAMKLMIQSNKKMTEAVSGFATGDLNVSVTPRSEKDILAKALNTMIETSKVMSSILSSIAEGDLTVNVSPRSDKDVLGLAFSTMTEKLRGIVGDIQTEVSELTSSGQEIVASVTQVSSGTAETAAAVTETTTTVEELKQTAQLSANKAQDVLKSAEETMHVVKNSEKLLQETQVDMGKINEKMGIISQGIIKLSEQSQAIGEIIDTVNDLAEQSNLLAVNAAIEAAKAGEQGKSFGVVAQEIRILAEQSKASTVQVRSILNEIQNATSAAVLATEQGLKAVEKGVSQSSQTSDSMVILTSSISRVTQAANQIAISSQQQLVGVDQVTIAMNNISEASSQHVEHMKQIETAVSALNAVAISLKEITDQYVLPTVDGEHYIVKKKNKQKSVGAYVK